MARGRLLSVLRHCLLHTISFLGVATIVAALLPAEPVFALPEQAEHVLVRVNGEPITESDLDTALGSSYLSLTNVETKQKIAAAALEKIIRDKIIEQDALSSRFVNSDSINAQARKLKTQLVISSYLDSLLAKPPFPSDTDIDTFAKEHPDLLSGRKEFHYTDVVLGFVDQNTSDTIDNQMDTVRRQYEGQRVQRDAFLVWLNAKGIKHLAEDFVQPTEQIEETRYNVLKNILSMEATKPFLDADSRLHVFFLLGAYPDPVTLDRVRGVLSRALLMRSRAKALDERIDQLVAQAKIEKVGEVSTAEAEPASAAQSIGQLGRRQKAWAAFIVALLLFSPVVSFFVLRRVWGEDPGAQPSTFRNVQRFATTLTIGLTSIWLVLPGVLLLVYKAPLAQSSGYRLPLLGGVMAGALGAFVWSQIRFARSRVLPGLALEVALSAILAAVIPYVII